MKFKVEVKNMNDNTSVARMNLEAFQVVEYFQGLCDAFELLQNTECEITVTTTNVK